MDRARRAAVSALVRLHRGEYASEAVDGALSAGKLSPRDRSFAGALFFTSAEHLVSLDYLLRPCLGRPLEKLDVEVRAILETGLCQMRYMRVPDRAAVNEAVALAPVFGKTSARGFINAVLRKAASAGALSAGVFSSEEERVCVTYSLSQPVARAIMEALPQAYEAYLQASWATAEMTLRVNPLRTTAEDLCEVLVGREAEVRLGPLPGSLMVRLPGGVAEDPFFEKGLYHVQDAASQYAAACMRAKAGERVLDLCAAPGGKSATMAQQMGGGNGLTVCDVNPTRLNRARKLFEQLGITGAAFLENDASVYNEALCGQDAVLCDVPCSGLGVLAAKPDLRYAKGENFATLPPLQLKILSMAARYVRQGGRLIYATCTIRPAENEELVRAFLAQKPEFRLIESPAAPEGVLIRDKMATFLPQCTATAGFFVASMERL